MAYNPRRNRKDLMHPIECKISDAILEIEKLPADVRLTDAQVLLQQGKDKLSDFLDATPELVFGEEEFKIMPRLGGGSPQSWHEFALVQREQIKELGKTVASLKEQLSQCQQSRRDEIEKAWDAGGKINIFWRGDSQREEKIAADKASYLKQFDQSPEK
jgi:hypothetical protein